MHMLKMGPVGRKKFIELVGDADRAEAIVMSHLESSNEDLQAALEADAGDEIARQALSENESILKRKYARLHDMHRIAHAHSTEEEFEALDGSSAQEEAQIAEQLHELLGQLKRKAVALQDEVQSTHSIGLKFVKIDSLCSAEHISESSASTEKIDSAQAERKDHEANEHIIFESRPKQAKLARLPLAAETNGHDSLKAASSAEATTQLHNLLQRTKRKAEELDADVLICSLNALDLSDSAKRFCS